MRSSRLLVGVTATALLGALATGWLVDHAPGFAQGAPAGGPPFDLADQQVIGEGAQLFRQTCTGYCHGKDGGPSRAPKLRASKLRSEEHTSELQSHVNLVCRLLLEKKKKNKTNKN